MVNLDLQPENRYERLRAILDSLFTFVALLDLDGVVVECNRAPLEAAGLKREDVIGKRFADAYWWSYLPSVQQQLLDAIVRARQGEVSRYDVLVRMLQNSVMPIDFTIAPLRNDAGEVEYLVASAIDISMRKQAEERLRLLAKVFEGNSEAIMITDRDNRIIAVNPAFTKLTGYFLEDVFGKDPKLLSSGHEPPEFYAAMWKEIEDNGHWHGEIWDRRKWGETYPKWLTINVLRDENGIVTNYIGAFSDISERKAAEARINYLARYDVLTGLPNRVLFSDRLTQAIAHAKRHQKKFALMFIDLDHFKKVNDVLGHHYGDLLLKEIAQRVRDAVRESDTVSRQGGDEFLVMVEEISGPEDAAHIADKIGLALSRPCRIGEHELTVTTSIGITLYPQDGESESVLLRNADIAMYHAKRNLRGTYQFFVEELNRTLHERLLIENDLRQALVRDQLELHYQPQRDLRNGDIVGYEALIRWVHPAWGMVLPAEFISIAEDSGQIIAIGEWVLAEACRKLKELERSGHSSLKVSVNVSAIQMRHKHFANLVRSLLEQYDIARGRLEIEVTESVLMQDTSITAAIMKELVDIGISFSIDDFGTGYSSLSYLKRFPIAQLKIDQSFVRGMISDPDDASIVCAVIALAHSLRMEVVAEGVETIKQADFLAAHGCDLIQGFYIARPSPMKKLVEELA